MIDDRPEWFADPDLGEPGLRFNCTMCGNCCTGPSGFVRFTEEEAQRLARRLGVTNEEFMERYTMTVEGEPSLNEVRTEHGYDCVFLDREKIPGRAVCGVYEDRPTQCRTWPFWQSNLKNPRTWAKASKTCPGMNTGKLVRPEEIRILRDKCDA